MTRDTVKNIKISTEMPRCEFSKNAHFGIAAFANEAAINTCIALLCHFEKLKVVIENITPFMLI